MKNTSINIKNKINSKSLEEKINNVPKRNSDINVLLNRIKLNKKNENKKKIYFSALASSALFLFGFLIF
tara:strand:+ start:175 stop:381 length:207 start_codon:yes stop_codon:yes gene_type:complete